MVANDTTLAKEQPLLEDEKQAIAILLRDKNKVQKRTQLAHHDQSTRGLYGFPGDFQRLFNKYKDSKKRQVQDYGMQLRVCFLEVVHATMTSQIIKKQKRRLGMLKRYDFCVVGSTFTTRIKKFLLTINDLLN